LDNPLHNPNSDFQTVVSIIDSIFTVLFLIEALIKIVALGFFYNHLHPVKPYFFNGWNVLDFLVVVASSVDFLFMITQTNSGGSTLKSLKALRALRALRPLRMISRNEGMRLVVNALFSSLPSMTNVLFVCFLSLLIFAITGINFYKGTFYSCQFSSLDLSFFEY